MMARHGVLVRHLTAIENLGSMDVLCTDKTGTLTEGKVDVSLVSDGTVDEPVDTLTNGRRLVLAAALRASPVDNGDEVFIEGRFVGTHTGDLPAPDGSAIPASGNKLELLTSSPTLLRPQLFPASRTAAQWESLYGRL